MCLRIILREQVFEFLSNSSHVVTRPGGKMSIINFCHSEACGGHFSIKTTTAKILQSGFYWPTLFEDTSNFCKTSERCQRLGAISRRNMMPLNLILIIEMFDCW